MIKALLKRPRILRKLSLNPQYKPPVTIDVKIQ